MNNVTIAALAFAGLIAGMVGCPVLRGSVSHPGTNAADTETMRSSPSMNPRDYTPLCELSGGRHCHSCPPTGPCPPADSGPLCCVGDVCVVWSGSHCSGDLGWCFSYSKEVGPSGVTKAACHDEPDSE